MNDKLACLEAFQNKYSVICEADRNDFSRVVSRFLSETFLIKDRNEDKLDYLFVVRCFELFENFFALLDYEIIHNENENFFVIRTLENRNRVKLKKLDTVILLVLRLFYHQQKKEISYKDKVMVRLDDIVNKVKTSMIFQDDKTITNYFDSLTKLKAHKIVSFSSKKFDENSYIEVYPSILYILPQKNLDEITTALASMSYEQLEGGDEDDHSNED